MRILAIILNVALLIMATLCVIPLGVEDFRNEEQIRFYILLSFGVPIISIIALYGTFKRSTDEK